MKKLVILLIAFTFTNCYESIDDSDANCSTDCSILQGKVITENNQGISDVDFTFEFKRWSTLGSYERTISKVSTDNNGNFYDEFYLKDHEIDPEKKGYFLLTADLSSLAGNTDLLLPLAQDFELSDSFKIVDRNNPIEQIFYIPKKTTVKVNLNNFVVAQEGDSFVVQSTFPFGFKDPNPVTMATTLDTDYELYSSKFYRATATNNTFEVVLAQNQKNNLRIFRRKNGVNEYEDLVLDVKSTSPSEITIDY